MFRTILFLVLFLMVSPLCALADSFTVTDAADNEINVELMPADGELLVIWLVDHDEERLLFEGMLQSVNRSGIEVWRIDLLGDYFIPRSSENERTMSGDGVAALIEAAHKQSNKQIVLVAYDRMPLPLLRGVRQWQQQQQKQATHEKSRLAGAVLFYPNLFGAPPIAGEDSQLDPIVAATNIPLTIYQPENGAQRLRLPEVMNALWRAGSPAISYIVPDVRDWFFMHPLEGEESDAQPATAAEKRATANIPKRLKELAHTMGSFPKPDAVLSLDKGESESKQVLELVTLKNPIVAPPFELIDTFGELINLEQYRGKVVLVNFWATWCPPCVEEVPSLNQLAERYRQQEFAVISIDFRESKKKVDEFMRRVDVDFPVLLDRDGKASLAWKVFALPSSFIIDRQGNIRFSANRAIDWNSEHVWQVVDRLLSE